MVPSLSTSTTLAPSAPLSPSLVSPSGAAPASGHAGTSTTASPATDVGFFDPHFELPEIESGLVEPGAYDGEFSLNWKGTMGREGGRLRNSDSWARQYGTQGGSEGSPGSRTRSLPPAFASCWLETVLTRFLCGLIAPARLQPFAFALLPSLALHPASGRSHPLQKLLASSALAALPVTVTITSSSIKVALLLHRVIGTSFLPHVLVGRTRPASLNIDSRSDVDNRRLLRQPGSQSGCVGLQPSTARLHAGLWERGRRQVGFVVAREEWPTPRRVR